MRSFVVLGDVGVYRLKGLDQARLYGGMPAGEPLRLYEGAALAGLAVEKAIAALDHSSPPRICRYLIPSDVSDDRVGHYPFGRFENFSPGAGPLANSSSDCIVGATATPSDKVDRLRIKSRVPKKSHPYGVHSGKLLESLRPGGLFAYGETMQKLRSEYALIRSQILSVDAINAVAKSCLEAFRATAKSQNLVKDWKSDAISKVRAPTGTAPSDELTVKLKEIVEIKDKDTTSQAHSVPDVLVLYDLYRVAEGDHTHDCGLRTVTVPQEFVPNEPYNGTNGTETYSEQDDVWTILRAWAGYMYGTLLDFSRRSLESCINEVKSYLVLHGANKADVANWNPTVSSLLDECKKACEEVLVAYGTEVISKDLARFPNLVPQWHDYLNTNGIWRKNPAGDTDYGPRHRNGKARHALFDASIRVTLSRMSRAVSTRMINAHRPSAIPLIVCCLKTTELSMFEKDQPSGAPGSYLEMLHHDPWLRERTVVILDADNLRKLKGQPAGIATESSWEEVAMDTVDAFQQRPQLKKYLDFGFIIIRYGVTGVLLLSRQPGGELTARLFFDPDKNDRDWTYGESGDMLGRTSLFASSIVQMMTERCEERGHEPVYSDLIEMLHHAVRYGLLRCQRSMCYGFGPVTDSKSEQWRFHGTEIVLNANGLPLGLHQMHSDAIIGAYQREAEPVIRDEDQLAEYQRDLKSTLAHSTEWISSSVIPTVRSQRWSIAEQSCTSEMEGVAFRITQRGIKHALNQKRKTWDDYVTEAAFNIRRTLPDLVAKYINERVAAIEIAQLEALSDSSSKSNEEMQKQLLAASKDAARKKLRVVQDIKDDVTEAIRRSITEMIEEAMEAQKWTIDSKSKIDAVLSIIASEIDAFSNAAVVPRKFDALRTTIKSLCVSVRHAIGTARLLDFTRSHPLTVHCAPVAHFGQGDNLIQVVDRREIEGVSAIQRLISHYVDTNFKNPEARPLSIAIFGPPGSGKSTAVKKIAKAHGAKISGDDLEFNLSQFTDVKELDIAFEKVANAKKAIPLVFFDEFDCKFEDTDFGWLKYFLAPMEDGRFGERKVGRAIFVFAGGTSYSFSAFSPKSPSPSDDRWLKFGRAKGPDFISRLSGHLNIIGIDPTDPDDELYLLRRALLIRVFLENKGAIDADGIAKIDDNRVLQAFLHAPTYRYGGRSLRMLIDACMANDGWIRRSSIPAAHELEMMVDSKSFLATLRSNWK